MALTKADKAGMSERAKALRGAREAFAGARECLMTSAKTGAGMRDLARWIAESVSALQNPLKSGIIKGL